MDVFGLAVEEITVFFIYMSKIIESWQNHTEKQSILERAVQIDKLTNESN